VVFVRGTENEPIDAGVSGADADELWVMDINSKKAETVLRPRAASNMAEVIAGISVPQFSQDSKSIYFLTAAWATSGAVHRLDLPTKEERFVAAGNRVKVIRTGEYDGFLRVNQKRYYKGGGTYWCDYVLTPDGKEVKVIEDSCEE
jgi:hypothetical protein